MLGAASSTHPVTAALVSCHISLTVLPASMMFPPLKNEHVCHCKTCSRPMALPPRLLRERLAPRPPWPDVLQCHLQKLHSCASIQPRSRRVPPCSPPPCSSAPWCCCRHSLMASRRRMRG